MTEDVAFLVGVVAALGTAVATLCNMAIQSMKHRQNLSHFFAETASMSRKRRWIYGAAWALIGMLWGFPFAYYLYSFGGGDGADSLGGLDLIETCRIQTADNNASVTLDGPEQGANAAFNWACVSDGEQSAIDIGRACRDTYGYDAVPRLEDYYSAYSWSCYRDLVRREASPDLVARPESAWKVLLVATLVFLLMSLARRIAAGPPPGPSPPRRKDGNLSLMAFIGFVLRVLGLILLIFLIPILLATVLS